MVTYPTYSHLSSSFIRPSSLVIFIHLPFFLKASLFLIALILPGEKIPLLTPPIDRVIVVVVVIGVVVVVVVIVITVVVVALVNVIISVTFVVKDKVIISLFLTSQRNRKRCGRQELLNRR